MIYLHKVVPLVLSPLFIVLVLCILGAVTLRRSWIIAGIVWLYLASVPITSNWIFSDVEKNAQRLHPTEVTAADAIVVLSYGMYWVKTSKGFAPEWTDPDRFFAGIELFQAAKAPILVFTKGKYSWQEGDETEGDVLKRYAEMMGVPGDRILLTDVAENTAQEAVGVKKLLHAGAKIILVTSAFHMPRAQRIFEEAGFSVAGYPVDIKIQDSKITPMSFLPTIGALSVTQHALQEHLGRLYYRLKHYFGASK
jgi:uncharacterized SAM-binding protein YcdF (DUF218 family)